MKARFRQSCNWAYLQPEERLTIIHIRDWHDAQDPLQNTHLGHFGLHCLQNTQGAEFVFKGQVRQKRRDFIVNASGLNDFEGTGLAELLSSYRGKPVKVGIMGVWTEAKVLFLSYELSTRYQEFEVGICSALTASSSRQTHFLALRNAEKILGVHVFPSVGAFTRFLADSQPELHRPSSAETLKLVIDASLSEDDLGIVRSLYRDCSQVDLKCLDGGFSGNVVMRGSAVDILGHRQVPTVVKIGMRDPIAEERTAFERIQEVMGNNAPAIMDFAEIGERGGIKYRYASMIGKNVRTFQDIIESGAPDEEVFDYLDTVFSEQLGRLYDAAENEKLDLLAYYDFNPKYAPDVRKNLEMIIEGAASDNEIEIFEGLKVPTSTFRCT